MPIDASIITRGIQQVQPLDPMQTLAQISAMRNSQLQREEARQRIEINRNAETRLNETAQLDQQKREEALTAARILRESVAASQDADGNLDYNKLQQSLIKSGQGDAWLTIQPKLLEAEKSMAELKKTGLGNAETLQNLIGSTAAAAASYPKEQRVGAAIGGLGWLVSQGVMTEEQATPYIAKIAGAPDQIDTLLESQIIASPKQMELRNARPTQPASQSEDFFLLNEDGKGGQNVKGSFMPGREAGSGQYFYNGQDVTSRVQPKTPERNPLADALAQERLDAMREQGTPLDVSADIRTTVAGGKYLDLSEFGAGKERDRARVAANLAGATPVSKEQADALTEIDTARQNQTKILTQVTDLLPRDSAGRIVASVGVPLSKIFQTNDQIAAFGTWRTAAINSLRATAGSKGLRINQAEIEAAIENDIPKLDDTLGTAQQKVKNVNAMLDSAESSVIRKNRQAADARIGTTVTYQGKRYKVIGVKPDGKLQLQPLPQSQPVP